MFDPIAGNVGTVLVHTTQHRGAMPEELAERALDKIIYVGADAHPHIREQAEAFKDSIRHVLIFYMHEAVRGHKTTLANKLRDAGMVDIIPILDA